MSDEFKDRWPDMHMKHLEFLQNSIARMGNNSANLKAYTMLIVTTMIGLAATTKESSIFIISLPIIATFSVIDANYLKIEKMIREKYNETSEAQLDKRPDFVILPNEKTSIVTAYTSKAILGFYLPVMAFLVALSVIIPALGHATDGSPPQLEG